ncbi:class I SAM-dependent methyltransferase [Rhizobium rhizogenes]|uniref:class I SAM-dependent methyltransferase n=1 Tax=Rhizobium rhizogenes TaxID=359 RepID=UPI001572E7C4|nr:class I SAM-dependent methyltransferase [Rhizobium rhizogenes]NTF42800.1 class I SAM-dependent methyltransferase [Rhizobium rhizogenes]
MASDHHSILHPFAPSLELKALAEKHGTDKVRYCPVYETYFREHRDLPLNILEIGVEGNEDPKAGGNSVRMWKEYFPNAQIYAIDIVDKSAHVEDCITIFQGSQDNEAFLKKVADQMGRIDIIIDDGSHITHHIIKTFEVLYPILATGGIYIVEDVGTSYWDNYGGSTDLSDPKTSVNYFKRLADGLNARHFRHQYEKTYADKVTKEVSFFENLVIMRKDLSG